MRRDVAAGSQETDLLACEENEPHGPLRPCLRGDGASDLDDERRVDAVVERAGPEVPRVQVRTEQDDLLGLLGPPDLGDDVLRFPWTRGLVVDLERDLRRLPLVEETRETQTLLAQDHRDRERDQGPVPRDDVAVEQVARAGRREENRRDAGLL